MNKIQYIARFNEKQNNGVGDYIGIIIYENILAPISHM